MPKKSKDNLELQLTKGQYMVQPSYKKSTGEPHVLLAMPVQGEEGHVLFMLRLKEVKELVANLQNACGILVADAPPVSKELH